MIAVVGSANMDLVARAPHIPKPGETVLGGGFAESPGGKGANQAMAIARLGSSAAFVASVGEDAHGDALLAGFVRAGMDVRFVARCATARTGVALIVVDEGGQNAIVVAPGANAELTPSFVRASVELLAPQVLLAQLEVPLATVEAAFAAAPKALKILNPAPAQDLPAGLLAATDVIVPNETETEVLTGILPDTDRTADAPRMPFVIGVMGIDGMKGDNEAPMMHFRAAQRKPATLEEFKGNVFAVETAPFWDDELNALHERMDRLNDTLNAQFNRTPEMKSEDRDRARQRAIEEQFTLEELRRLHSGVSNGGYHYLGAAKIMAPIGKAFAEALIRASAAKGQGSEGVIRR